VTYDEAMAAVTNNTMPRESRAALGGRTMARRPVWDNEPERARTGVIYYGIFVGGGETLEAGYEYALMINRFGPFDPEYRTSGG
jgi:hypothetical protein